MPLDAAMLSQLSGAVPSNMDWFNAFTSLGTNYVNQEFSKGMYNRTRRDNIEFWNMNNAYNTPAAQMGRFKDAGLNPNLIYGQGNSGNSAPIPTPDTMPVTMREPRFEGNTNAMANLLGQADLRIKNAQADNLAVQNEVLIQDAQLRKYQALHKGYEYDFDVEMRGTSADFKREALRNLTTRTDIEIDRYALEAARTSQNIAESMERVLTLQEARPGFAVDRSLKTQQIEILKKDGTLKDVEIKLRENGINPDDPMWARYVGKFLEDWLDGNQNPASKGVLWKMIFGGAASKVVAPLQNLPPEMKGFRGPKY